MTHTLRTEQVQVATLRPHPGNPRNGDTDAIAESLRTNGQFRPIVVAKDGTVLAGNHTYAAAMQLGWKSLAVVRLNLEPDSPQAKRIMVADNRIADRGRYDDTLLLQMLNDILDSEPDLSGTGYDPVQLDDLVARIEEAGEMSLSTITDPQNIRHTNTFEQDGAGYADRAQRLLILTLAPGPYAWLVDALQRVAEQQGDPSRSNTQVVARLAADALGEDLPPGLAQ